MTSISHRFPLAALAAICSFVQAQEDPRSGSPRLSSFPISYEAIPVFRDDTTKAYVTIHYRLREDFFIILRNTEIPADSPFLGRGELAVELLNESGSSVAREIRQIRLRGKSIPTENEEFSDLQGVISLGVPEGTYTVVFNIEDRQSERKFLDRRKTVTTRKPLVSGLDLSVPVFAHLTSTGESYEALNRGTDILFGNAGGALFSVCGMSGQPPIVLAYKLTNRPDAEGLEPQEFSGSNFIVTPGIPIPAERKENEKTSASPILYHVEHAAERWKTLFVLLPFEKLLPGQSKLWIQITSGAQKKDFTIDFRVHWFSRPFSLSDFDLAVDALQHIAKDEEISNLRTLSASHNARAFFDFWRKKDPDTLTAYNELLAEYYRRVDTAIRDYSTSRGNDGYKTDRGRVFILYGAPANTERVFSPDNAPREIWTYPSLKRRFIFEDARKNGSFGLIRSETL